MKETAFEQVSSICLGFDGVTQRASHGAPSFFAPNKKQFLMLNDDHHGDGRLAMWCAAAPGVQELRVEAEPDVFFVPAYVGHRGWLGVRLDRGLDAEEVAGLCEDAFEAVTSPR